jgi:CRISPR/Cas system-associated exonuclease Cas4 (RecB family)
MSIGEAEGLETEYAFIAGLRDGDFPSRPGIDYLLPDNLRKRLGLVHAEQYLLRQKFLFRRILSSAQDYTLSYSAMDGDRLFLPSSFLSRKEKSAHPRTGIYSWEEDLIRKSRKKPPSLISNIRIADQRLIRKRFGENSPIRVTDIDAYRTCPRRFFLEKVLCLKPREIATFALEALTLGTIVHEIMQEIQTTSLGGPDTFIPGAGRAIDEVLSRKHLDGYWASVVRETMMLILPRIFAIEQRIAGEGFVFAGAEVPITGEIVPGITLKGKIDRIDSLISRQERHDGAGDDSTALPALHPGSSPVVELIDYKTGPAQFGSSRILSEGVSLQLFLYAALIKAQGMIVERVGIYSLKDLSISWIPGRQDRKNGRTIDDYIVASIGYLKETISQIRKGEFPSDPLNDQTCRNCHERPYCPFIQKNVTL